MIRENVKRRVITFDPTVIFWPRPYQIEGFDYSYRVLGVQTLIFRVLVSLFWILPKTKVRIKKSCRVNLKRWVITFDPTVCFKPIRYHIERIGETVVLIYYRLKTDDRIKSYDSSFELNRQNFWIRKNLKRWVITFDPIGSFWPLPYQIEGFDDSYRVLGFQTLIYMVFDSVFSILSKTEVRIKILLGKLKTMSHNFWSDRQFSVYKIWNRRYRRNSRFDILSAETWRSDQKLWLIIWILMTKLLIG